MDAAASTITLSEAERPSHQSLFRPAASIGPATPAPTPTQVVSDPSASDPTGRTLDEKTVAKLQKILDNQVDNKDVAGLQAAIRLPSGEWKFQQRPAGSSGYGYSYR